MNVYLLGTGTATITVKLQTKQDSKAQKVALTAALYITRFFVQNHSHPCPQPLSMLSWAYLFVWLPQHTK